MKKDRWHRNTIYLSSFILFFVTLLFWGCSTTTPFGNEKTTYITNVNIMIKEFPVTLPSLLNATNTYLYSNYDYQYEPIILMVRFTSRHDANLTNYWTDHNFRYTTNNVCFDISADETEMQSSSAFIRIYFIKNSN